MMKLTLKDLAEIEMSLGDKPGSYIAAKNLSKKIMADLNKPNSEKKQMLCMLYNIDKFISDCESQYSTEVYKRATHGMDSISTTASAHGTDGYHLCEAYRPSFKKI